MPNYLGMTPSGGHLVEDDAGAVFHLPDAPTWGTPADTAMASQPTPPAPIASVFEPAPMAPQQVTPYLGPDIQGPAVSMPAEPAPKRASAPATAKAAAPSFNGAMQEQLQGLQAQQDAAFAGADLAAQDSAGRVDVLQQQEARLRAQEEAAAQRAQEREQQRMDAARDVDAAMKRWQDHKVDRGNLWASKSTGSKWALALSMLASGWASANTGKLGENPALSIWLKAVDDDVALQMEEGRKKQNAVGLAQSRVADIDKLSERDDVRANLRRAAIIDQSKRELEMHAAKMMPGAAQAAALDAAGKLGEKAGAYQMQAAEQIAQDKARRSQIGLGYANLKENQRQFDISTAQKQQDALVRSDELSLAQQKAAIDVEKGRRELNATLVPGLKLTDGSDYYAPTPAEADRLRKAGAASSSLLRNLGEMKRMISQYGGTSNLPSEAKSKLQQLSSAISADLKEDLSLGAWDNGSKALAESLAGGAKTGWSTFLVSATPAIEQLESQIKNRYNDKVKSMVPNAAARVWEEAAPTPTTYQDDKLQDLGKASAGTPGYVSRMTGETSAAGLVADPVKLPTTVEAMNILQPIFDQANAGSKNSPSAIAQLKLIESSDAYPEGVRAAASVARQAIGKKGIVSLADLYANPREDIDYSTPSWQRRKQRVSGK